MKKIILILTFICTLVVQSQEYRKIVPFKYQDKWGLVDSTANEFLKPTYKSVNIYNDFMYAEFDGQVIYNLKTGSKQKALGKYINSIQLKKEMYHVFSDENKSYITNSKNQKTRQLSNKYSRLDFTQLYNRKNEKANVLVRGFEKYYEVVLLKKDKKLTSIISEKLNTENLEFIENQQGNIIGFVVKQNGKYVFYNHKLKKIKKIKIPKKIDSYSFFTPDIVSQLPKIYDVENVKVGCADCAEIWDNSWDLSLLLHAENTDTKGDYYLSREGRNYIVKHKEDNTFTLEMYPDLFDYDKMYKAINISKIKSLFFYDSKYIRTPAILFPKKYFVSE